MEPFGDEWSKSKETCPACGGREVWETVSLNFGNLVAYCDTCDTEWNITQPDYKEIVRESRRGY